MACKYRYKGGLYTQEELLVLPEFKDTFAKQQLERSYVNNNTGENTNTEINFFMPAEGEAGVFTKFLQFKKSLLSEYNKRLNKLGAEKRKKDITIEYLTKLNNLERELKLRIEGNYELGILGLKQEIKDLEKNATIDSVGIYAEKDLQRLEKLASSNNVDDLREAQYLIDFYNLAGTFKRNIDNPFFTQEEMFLEDENSNLTTEFRLSDTTMQKFKDWGNLANSYQNIIDKRKEEITVNTINNDSSVKRTYKGKEFAFNDIVKSDTGLKDVDWISMWTMDITQGISSNNGIIPQVMFSFLANRFEERLSWERDYSEKIDKLNPEVIKELRRLNQTLASKGIVGLQGTSYQIFKEITKDGNETGGLIQKFNKEYFDNQSKALNKFRERFDDANIATVHTTKNRLFNTAFEELKKWRRNSNIIIDINSIPKILNNPEFASIVSNTNINSNHEAYLISLLGQKGYDEQIEKQTTLLRKYLSEKQSMLETLLIMENKSNHADLSDKAKNDLLYWENNHNPLRGIEDYDSVNGVFFAGRKSNNFMDYNTFVPRKFKANISSVNGKYVFTDTTIRTENYNDTFNEIEKNPTLNEFYELLKEGCETFRENMPYEVQQKMAVNTLPALMKTSSEIIADNNTSKLSALFAAFRHLTERIRLSFGVNKQSELSYATIDPVTGKSNYKVNDQFIKGNTKAVEDRMIIEKTKFIQNFNSTIKNDADKLVNIKRFTTKSIHTMNTPVLVQLAQYLHVDISLADIQAKKLDKLIIRTGEIVDIGRIIKDFSIHSVVQSQSFDLAKIMKYYAKLTMQYAARQEALPVMEIMKQHYENIKKPETNNVNENKFHVPTDQFMTSGVRTKAITQMDDWFERVVLDNYGTKHIGVHGGDTKIDKLLGKIDNMGGKTDVSKLIKNSMPRYYEDIYSTEEKKKLTEIEGLLKNETDDKKIVELNKIKAGLGKKRTATAIIDNLLSWIRTLRLGYNISSASTNFLEGVTSNMILASQGDYFDPQEIYHGYGVIKSSFLKNVSFGLLETGEAKKNRSLMDKFNVIMDSKNELQKSSIKTRGSKLSWLSPHELNQRVEYINQSPIMIAMLRTLKIKDKSGNESTIWNAMSNSGHLKDEFKTNENINNWEHLKGDDYLGFKQKMHKAIVLGHGNYDELRGMMIKSGSAGKALMMFKTWIPMQFYWRFASEQDDIQSGTQGFKGRYLSYGKGTAAVHGTAIGAAMFGPIGAIAGGALGAYLGNQFGTDSGIGMLKESIEATKQIFKKAIGMPINIIAGRKLIGTGDKAFEDWVVGGKGTFLNREDLGEENSNFYELNKFTAQDAKNMRGNMADITMQLAWLAMILLTKSLFWDDDDKPDDAERIAHNILVNKLMQLSSQAAMYTNPVDTYKSTIGSNAMMQYLIDCGKEVVAIENYFEGRDIIQSGINAGESKLKQQTHKIAMPGLFKDTFFGFETQAERVFEESPFHPLFRSDKVKDKEDNKRDRAKRRLELEKQYTIDQFDDEKAMEKQINNILDEELPTPTRLKKLQTTREEYKKDYPTE